MQFKLNWVGEDGVPRNHERDDWETSAAFNRFDNQYGRTRALEILKDKYEREYFGAGLALAFSTHSRRNVTYNTKNQWLLVGLIRIDHDPQTDLFLNG